ncbi:MAG: ATP-binding protein [Nitrospinae bacterium]|nr:ATP-binding protein [Nitrospinota bacterium]
MNRRKYYRKIWEELSGEKSMVFLAGPRQTGKTTLSKIISHSFTNSLYFNWDILADRERFINNPVFFEEIERKDTSNPFVIFDELHKYKDWKNYLKGVYDAFSENYHFLVTGSGRLDLYQKGGDSLAGRYYLFHLWPFTIAELGERNTSFQDFISNPLDLSINDTKRLSEIWNNLASFSGFPEPYLKKKETSYRRWSTTYSRQLIREDIRELSEIKSIGEVETLFTLIPARVGSPFSIPSVSSLLKVSYNSVNTWLNVLEKFFLIFTISPWSLKIPRSIHKERKVYLWNSPLIKDESARFENMVAIELWRAVTNWNDLGYGNFSLHYIKNKEKEEVDFLIANDNEPLLLVEAKLNETRPSNVLRKFQKLLNVPAAQLTFGGTGFKLIQNADNKILVAPAYQWLSTLP